MCNIAGYVGNRQAAPILVDMMRRQEGWDCGHYTGLAVIGDGQLRIRKNVGNMDMVLGDVDLAEYPGTVGFIHSRTPGKKGQINEHWAHPFVGNGGRFAYVVNGCGGVFSGKKKEEVHRVYLELIDEGYTFNSWSTEGTGNTGLMPDGRYIHSSEFKCQLIQRYMDTGMDTRTAIAALQRRFPSEAVSLGLNLDEPDCIVWGRINYPMFAGFADHGIYLATTPQAMPDDARNITLLNSLSSGRVYCDRIETVPELDTENTVATITPSAWKSCYEAMEKVLAESEMDHDQLDRLIRPLFEKATCPPESAVNYAIMDHWERQGRLQIFRTQCPGTAPDSTAPKLTAKLR